jgi:UDP-glucose 4-epimerase
MINNTQSVCLLGATGFLGSAIAKELDAKNISWCGISREDCGDSRVKTLSLSETTKVVDIFKSVDIVINALGSAKPKDFEDNPEITLSTIWDNAERLAELLKQGEVKKLVHISSAGTVYGEHTHLTHTENADLLPISWYGKAKVIEELYLEKSCFSNNVDYLCLRVTNPYGNEKKTTHGFIDVLLHSVLSKNKFSFYQDCNPVRDFIYANDMAFSCIKLIELQCKGIFNIGSGKSYSLEELANYVNNKLAGKTLIERSHNKPVYDVLINRVNIEKLVENGAHRSSMDVYKYIDNVLEKGLDK